MNIIQVPLHDSKSRFFLKLRVLSFGKINEILHVQNRLFEIFSNQEFLRILDCEKNKQQEIKCLFLSGCLKIHFRNENISFSLWY